MTTFLRRAIADRLLSLYAGTMVIALIGAMLPGTAHAQSAWQVDAMSGAVWVHTEGAQPVALTSQKELTAGAVIETGETGRIVLIRGEESIIVAPNTSIGLPATSSRGMATTILQKVGTILLSVEKKAAQHFEVETPYLAAVVKGTKFTVSVGPEGAAVHVVEGAVEVIDLDTGEVGMARPGHTAVATAIPGHGLKMSGPGAKPAEAGPARTERRVTPVADPVETADAGAAAAGPRADRGVGRSPVLTAALGQEVLNVASVTGGLVRDGNGPGSRQSGPGSKQSGNGAGGAGNGGGASGIAASSGGTSPGLGGGTAPGQSGSAPGQSASAPGLSGAAPGQGGTPPGLGGGTPPGQGGTPPGLGGGTPPGQGGTPPGLGGGTPPGQGGTPPGKAKK